jgi:hypothetical protein
MDLSTLTHPKSFCDSKTFSSHIFFFEPLLT